MERYCPTCSRSSNDCRFIGEFCEPCTVEKMSKNFPDMAKLEYCKRCDRIKIRDGHRLLDKHFLGEQLSRELCKSKCKIKVKSFDEKEADVIVSFFVDNEEVSFEKKIKLRLINSICQDCYRKSSGYYEAIVQLRGPKEKVDAMLKKIDRFIGSKGAFISKIDNQNNGIDIYISDKQLIKTYFMYRHINPKASYTLYTIKNGKEVYRHTYFLDLDPK